MHPISLVVSKIGEKLLKPTSPRVVCPPGKLTPGEGKLVLVPTLMRSGTHLLIDTIINNFSQYKRSPLYVELDTLLEDPSTRHQSIDGLLKHGGYVIKTHYPQLALDGECEALVRKIIDHSWIITTERDLKQSFLSTTSKDFCQFAQSQENYQESVERFKRFWGQFNCLKVSFSDMINRSIYPSVVSSIGQYIGVKPNPHIIYPPLPKERFQVYFTKAVTRLVGRYSPVVNTTIGFRISR